MKFYIGSLWGDLKPYANTIAYYGGNVENIIDIQSGYCDKFCKIYLHALRDLKIISDEVKHPLLLEFYDDVVFIHIKDYYVD